MGNNSSRKELDTYGRCSFNVNERFECLTKKQNNKYNKKKITQKFCLNFDGSWKSQTSADNCKCINCLRTVWNVQTSAGNFKYEGKVRHNKICWWKSSGRKLIDTVQYSWRANGKGKSIWISKNNKVGKSNKVGKNNKVGKSNKINMSHELDAYFSDGAIKFGSIKYNDGSIYRGGFQGFEYGDLMGFEYGDNCNIMWSDGSIFKGRIPYEDSNKQLLTCTGLFIPGGKNKQNNLVDYISPGDVRKIIWNYLEAIVMLRFAGKDEQGDPPIIVSVYFI